VTTETALMMPLWLGVFIGSNLDWIGLKIE